MSKSCYVELATDKHKKKFGHYLTNGEGMVIFTTVSKAYLITKFILRFFVVSLITIPLFYLVHRFFNYGLPGTTGTALLLALVYATLRYYFTKEGIQYILTNRRVIIQIGYFKVTLYSVNYNKITHIEVDQNILERVFYKHGRLIINTSGMDNKPITLNYLSSPIEFKNIMERLIAQERHKYGHTGI